MNMQSVFDLLFPAQCGGCEAPGTGACERCLPRGRIQTHRLATLRVTSLAPYGGDLRCAILALKSGRRDVARAFAARLSELLDEDDIVVPVPTTAARRRERGFDGCELVAHLIAQRSGVTVYAHLVQTAGDRQRGRDRHARLAAKGRFTWKGPAMTGRAVTLLDDVVTTGSTLEDCAATLRRYGAAVEKAIVVARA
jgi:ComF family protein